MQHLVIASYKFKIKRILIYLLLGVIFSLLNLHFIDLGTSKIKLDMMEQFHQKEEVLSIEDNITYAALDALAWPIILLRNLFVHFNYLFVLVFEVGVGVWLVRTRFEIVEVIKEVIRRDSV